MGLTGLEFARRAGVSPSYVSLIEHGEKIPSDSVAVRMARVLGDDERLYRAWAATSRMDEATRDAVLALGARPEGDRAGATCGCLALPLFIGDVRHRELVRTDRTPRDRPRLSLDCSLVGRSSPLGLVALQLEDHHCMLPNGTLRVGDVVVVDLAAGEIEPGALHAVEVGGVVRIARLKGNGHGWEMEPGAAGETAPEGTAPAAAEAGSVVGPVVWSGRRWERC
jgi:transcriptional regulator with XRE-family HTH domain